MGAELTHRITAAAGHAQTTAAARQTGRAGLLRQRGDLVAVEIVGGVVSVNQFAVRAALADN